MQESGLKVPSIKESKESRAISDPKLNFRTTHITITYMHRPCFISNKKVGNKLK